MNRRASMELSVNSIVILVIAVVMMGLILGFIKSKFDLVGRDLLKEEREPDPASISYPISMSRTEVRAKPNDQFALKLNIYNSGATQLTSIRPAFKCPNGGTSEFIMTGTFFEKTIEPNNQAYYLSLIKTNSVAKGSYLCKVCASTDTTCPSTVIAEKEFQVNIG